MNSFPTYKYNFFWKSVLPSFLYRCWLSNVSQLAHCFIFDILIFPSSTGCSQSASLEPEAIGIYFPLRILLLPFKLKLSLLNSFSEALWKGELRTVAAAYIWEFHSCWLCWEGEGWREEYKRSTVAVLPCSQAGRYSAAWTTVTWNEKKSSCMCLSVLVKCVRVCVFKWVKKSGFGLLNMGNNGIISAILFWWFQLVGELNVNPEMKASHQKSFWSSLAYASFGEIYSITCAIW